MGRALRKGEYKCKVYFLKLSEINDETEGLPFGCEWILRNGAEVGQTKRDIIAHLASLGKYDLKYDMCRLRRKLGRLPMDVYTDEQKFGDDVRLNENMEVGVLFFF